MAELRYYAKIENGLLPEGVGLAVRAALKEFEQKNIIITIKEVGKQRSIRQNAFYWGVIVPAVKQLFESAGTTCTPDDVHCYLKEHVGGMMKVMLLPDGSRRAVVESSTKLTTAEWEAYITKIRAWGAGWGLDIPEPNEYINQN